MADDKATKQKFWSDQISNSLSVLEPFWKRAEQVQTIYREGKDDFENRHFALKTRDEVSVNVLYANTQVLSPAVLSRIPTPDIRKTIKPHQSDITGDFEDRAKMADAVSEVLERFCSFMADKDSFSQMLMNQRDDYLIPGRGIARFKYRARLGKDMLKKENRILRDESDNPVLDETGEVASETIYLTENGREVEADGTDNDGPFREIKLTEEIIPEYVFYRDFIHAVDDKSLHKANKNRTIRNYRDAWWIGYRHSMTEKEIETSFKDAKPKLIVPDEFNGNFDVWEIWDRRGKKRIWMTENANDIFVEEDAPLSLSRFYPGPKPLEAVHTTDDIIPLPLYMTYQDQAIELNEVEQRLFKNTRMMKWSGMVDGSIDTTAWNIQDMRDGEFLPTKEATGLRERGGLAASMFSPPLADIAVAIQALTARRAQLTQTIQEVTGISDIIRGFSDPRDGVGTQRLKGTFGTLRLRPLRQPMEENIRDCYRIMVEIALDKFDQRTWADITNINITDEMFKFMKNDALTEFLIDVETDATVLPNSEIDQINAVQYTQVMTQAIAVAFQSTQLAPESSRFFSQSLKFLAQNFKAGRNLEDEIDNLADILQRQGEIAVQMRIAQAASGDQALQQEASIEQQKINAGLQKEALKARASLEREMLRLQGQREKSDADLIETRVRQAGQNRSEELDFPRLIT